jgi:hypothetical protein
MNRKLSLLFGVALMALGGTSAEGQLAVSPLVGGYIPGSSLKDVKTGASNVAVKRDGTLAFGVNLDVGSLRGSLAYASGTTIRDANKADIGKGTVLAAAADIVLRPLPRIIVQPYALGGVGVKNLSYDKDSGITNAFPKDTRELAIHAGLGADAVLGPFGVVAEITDFISRDANDKWGVHDAFLMAGIKLRL